MLINKNKNSNIGIEIKGSLNERSYLTILSDIYHDNGCGHLNINSDINLEIYFYNGLVKFVESDQPELLLGKLLLENEFISEEEQHMVLDFSRNKGTKLGQELVESGFLTPHELSYILELQTKLKLINGFGLSEGEYKYWQFYNSDPEITFNINPVQVIYEAVDGNLFLENFVIKEEDPKVMLYPSLYFFKIYDLNLSSSKQFKIINLLKEPINLSEVLSKSPLDQFKTLRLIKFLETVQFIRVRRC